KNRFGQLPGTRPEPPDHMEPDEAIEWAKIVARMPPDWFTSETLPILIELCSAIVTSRRLKPGLAPLRAKTTAEGFQLGQFMKLARAKMQASLAVANLSTKLRLTHQSRYDQSQADANSKKSNSGLKPWELLQDDDPSESTN